MSYLHGSTICSAYGTEPWGLTPWGTLSSQPPIIISISPADGATGVPSSAYITVLIGDNSCAGLIIESIIIEVNGTIYFNGTLYAGGSLDVCFTAAAGPNSAAASVVIPGYAVGLQIVIEPVTPWEVDTLYKIEVWASNDNGTAYKKSYFKTMGVFAIETVELITLNSLVVSFTAPLNMDPVANPYVYDPSAYEVRFLVNSLVDPGYFAVKEVVFSSEVSPKYALLYTSTMTAGASYEIVVSRIMDVFGRTIINRGSGKFIARNTKGSKLLQYFNPLLVPSKFANITALLSGIGLELEKAGGDY